METDITQNHETGRKNRKVKAFVIHKTDGSFASAMAWTHDPKSQASYHVIIDTNGKMVKTVEFTDTAWACGTVKNATWPEIEKGVNPNLYTLNIGLAGKGTDRPTDAQIYSLCKFIASESLVQKIKLSQKMMVFHREIRADKTCPGDVPSKQILLAMIKGFRQFIKY